VGLWETGGFSSRQALINKKNIPKKNSGYNPHLVFMISVFCLKQIYESTAPQTNTAQ